MKKHQKQLDTQTLKKELFRFLKEKGVDEKSGINILQVYKYSITLWWCKRQEDKNTTFSCPLHSFEFALARAINNCNGRVGCDVINNSFNWQISAHEYNLDFALWPTLDTEWNEKNLQRWYKQ